LTNLLPDNQLGFKLRSIYWKKHLGFFGDNIKICSGTKFYGYSNISIGKKLSSGNNVVFDASNSHGIYLGKYISIADGVYFRAANYNYENSDKNIQQQMFNCAEIKYLNKSYSIIIEDDVWIGARAIILSGSKIGKGSIIASKAVVNCDIPANEIWGGVPAKFLKKRYN
tara:strand:+ start:1383 stop:1889 length:507 start_codon:yes stop_codon:yes gene_type:complete